MIIDMLDFAKSDAFKAMRIAAMFNMELPPSVFFTPRPEFAALLRAYTHKGIELIDCGCGMGQTLTEADRHDLPLRGVDLSYRKGQHPRVERVDATELLWSPARFPLICRPDHSGWHCDVIETARSHGASSIYIGLSRNYERDLSMFRTQRIPGIFGEEGEKAWIVRPLKNRRTQ